MGLDYWAVKEEPEREIQKEIFGMFTVVVIRAISEIKGIEKKEVVGTVAENTRQVVVGEKTDCRHAVPAPGIRKPT